MLNRLKIYLKNFDWIIFFPVFFLVIFGMIEIYSISLGQGELDVLNFKKQIVFAGIGFLALFIFSFIDSYFVKSLSRYWYVISILLLIAVLVFGKEIRGTRGWFSIFGLRMQPVEFVRVILIMSLAKYFSDVATKVKNFRHFFISGLLTIIPFGLIMLQPDFGSAVMLLVIWLILMFAAGFNKKYFLLISLTAIVTLSSAWFLFFSPYQQKRIINFINPEKTLLTLATMPLKP